MGLLAAVFLFLLPQAAHAFPEMLRHHYVNCNACHVNPNGGGLLTEYGRGMAGEVLSTWQYENESLFLHGLIKPDKMPKFLNIGGDIRAVQVHRETKQVREGRYVLMQTSVETGLTAGPITAVGALGRPDSENHIQGGITRYYLLGNLSDSMQVKAGRFLPAFGINDPHHILVTRQALGFGFGSERNAVEAHYSGEQWHAAAGVSKSRLDSAVAQEERAVSLQVEKFFLDSYRVGFSLWKGESDQQKRWLWSLHAMLGFTEHFYFLAETTWQKKMSLLAAGLPYQTGIFHFGRLGYEVYKGIHIFGLENISQTVLSDPSSLMVQLGGGTVWYPRPHLEFELVYSQRKILKQSPSFEDYAYLMLHYYL